MATIILGTAGQIFGGPIGGLIGTAIGGAIDRNVLGGGGGRAREGGRISNPALQSATYGEPIPIIVGRMRTAGNLIWSSGIIERSSTSGGGKRSGSTATYSYAASFAVGLVAGRIVGVGRIWADGKIIRTGDGTFLTPITMRLHDGGANQAVDPLLAAALGPDGTPAFRALAYVVFEDLPLGDFGNRIPNLTFEIIADAGPVDAGVAMMRIAAMAGFAGLTCNGAFPALAGYMVGRAGSLAEAMAPLIAIADAAITTGDTIGVVTADADGIVLPAGIGDARRPGDNRDAERQRRAGADTQPGCLELAFYDASRDFQPGLARVRRSSQPAIDQRSIAAAIMPDDARRLALHLLAAGEAARREQTVRLPWRWLGLGAGDTLTIEMMSGLWRIRERRFENFVVHLDLVRVCEAMRPEMVLPLQARAANVAQHLALSPAGPTQLHILDLPALPGEMPTLPRLWVAGNGSSHAWRRAGVAVSLDAGASYTNVGTIVGGTIIGTLLTPLGPGSVEAWDRFNVVDVELLTDRDWLEGCSEAAVLAGSNLALIGDELVQFAEAEAIGPRRFRLRGLLRGRRGSEAAVAGHNVGERFIVIDPTRMLAFDPPLDTLGRSLRFVATGHGDADQEPLAVMVGGAALRPLSPTRLTGHANVDGIALTWVRRSRAGYGWNDFVDAPVGEAMQGFTVTLRCNGRTFGCEIVGSPAIFISAARIAGNAGGDGISVDVAQNSDIVGPGLASSITLNLANGEIEA